MRARWNRRDVLRGAALGATLGLGSTAATGVDATAGGETITLGLGRLPERPSPFEPVGTPIYDAVFDTGAVRDAKDGRLRPWTLDWTRDDAGVTLSLGADRPVWPDGSELSVADVAFTFAYVTDESAPERRNGQYSDIDANSVERVEVMDDSRVRLSFGSRPGAWTRLLTVPLLPESVWSGVQNPREYAPEAALSGSGLYAAESVGDNRVTLTLRDDPHPTHTALRDLLPTGTLPDGDPTGPFVSTIVVRGGIRNGDAAISAVENDGYTAAQPRNWGSQATNDSVRTSPSWQSKHILFNTRRTPFDDPAFRRFLAETWDASAHMRFRGAEAGDADAPVETERGVVERFERTRGSFIRDGEVDVEAARSALEAATGGHRYEFRFGRDYNVSTDDGRVLHVNGVHFSTHHSDNEGVKGEGPLEIFAWTSDSGVVASLERWEDVLRAIGIPTLVKRISTSAYVERVVRERAFDLTEINYRFAADGGGLVPMYASTDAVSDAIGLTGYSGADRPLSRALSATKPADRTTALADAAVRIYRDVPGFAVEHGQTVTAVNESWSGWVDAASGPLNRLSYHAVRSPQTRLVEATPTPTPTPQTATPVATAEPNDRVDNLTKPVLTGVGLVGAVYAAGKLFGWRGGDDASSESGEIDSSGRPPQSRTEGADTPRGGRRNRESIDGTEQRVRSSNGNGPDGDDSNAGDGAAAAGPADADEADANEAGTDGEGRSEPVGEFIREVPGLEPAGGRIGEDGHVVVYEAVAEGDRTVHVVTLEESVEESRYDSFERATKQWSALSTDENVVSVVETGTEPRPWVAVEPVQHCPTAGDLPNPDPEDVVDIVGAACQAVQGASLYNVRHLALTPGRLLIEDDSEGFATKVSLWCLDDFLDVEGPTPFTAPEQLPGAELDTGKPTDTYRLGAIAYTMLCGEPPFDPSSPTLSDDIETGNYVSLADREDVESEAVRSFAGVVDKALSVEPGDRYSSAHHLRTALYGSI